MWRQGGAVILQELTRKLVIRTTLEKGNIWGEGANGKGGLIRLPRITECCVRIIYYLTDVEF